MQVRMIIFGGTGDLTSHRLMPALFNLYQQGQLSADSDILAVGRHGCSQTEYRQIMAESIRSFARFRSQDKIDEFLALVHYLNIDFTDPAAYQSLRQYVEAEPMENAVRLIDLAVTPQHASEICRGLASFPGIRNYRVMLEKPFGSNLEEACALNRLLEETFGSSQIYRIDQYLGKEMVRNILTLRQANSFFTDVWSHQTVQSVEISALEKVGVETRGRYYEAAGAMRDMVQSSLLQILSVIALEDPESPDIHGQQMGVLNALHQIHVTKIRDIMILGQYAGYQSEENVARDSQVETYAALRLQVDLPRWKDVPFLLRTGRKCRRQETQAVIHFRRQQEQAAGDDLIIRIQPTQEVRLEFNVHKPGAADGLERVRMEYCQSCNDVYRRNTPEAYEQLLDACMNGDRAWFSGWDQIETCWRYGQSLSDAYAQANLPVYPYEPGTYGPEQADALVRDLGGWQEER